MMANQDDVPEGKISDVLGWVNDADDLDERKDRAQTALDKETSEDGEDRSTLKASLRQIIESDTSGQADDATRQPAGAGTEDNDVADEDTTQTTDDETNDATQQQAPGNVADEQVVSAEQYAEETDDDTTTVDPVYVRKDGRLHQVAQIRTR